MDKHIETLLEEVKQIILKIVNEEHGTSLGPEDLKEEEEIAVSPILQMDSLMAIRLVVELEKTFGISIPDEDLDMEYFKTAAAITGYVSGKLGEHTCGK